METVITLGTVDTFICNTTSTCTHTRAHTRAIGIGNTIHFSGAMISTISSRIVRNDLRSGNDGATAMMDTITCQSGNQNG